VAATNPAAAADLRRAKAELADAELLTRPSERFLAAQLAALRGAAVALAVRAPAGGRASRPRNTWALLAEVAPELGEWAAFFAATQAKSEAVRAGATAIVSAREADDLVRDAAGFLGQLERSLFRVGRSRLISVGAASG
jgi:hypothetical protein